MVSARAQSSVSDTLGRFFEIERRGRAAPRARPPRRAPPAPRGRGVARSRARAPHRDSRCNRCRQRRLSASVISRALFDVSSTSGRCARLERAELGHRDLEVGEHLEQERLELGVGAVDLVDEQHRCASASGWRGGAAAASRKRSEKNASSCAASLSTASASVVGAGDDLADLVAQDLRVEELLGILPLVERLGLVEPFVALQADELGRQRRRQHLGQLGLADAGRTLDEDRLLHAIGEEHGGGDAAIAHVGVRAQARR